MQNIFTSQFWLFATGHSDMVFLFFLIFSFVFLLLLYAFKRLIEAARRHS